MIEKSLENDWYWKLQVISDVLKALIVLTLLPFLKVFTNWGYTS